MSIAFNDCTFTNNTGVYGGAVYSDWHQWDYMYFICCKFHLNTALSGGAVLVQGYHRAIFGYCQFT